MFALQKYIGMDFLLMKKANISANKSRHQGWECRRVAINIWDNMCMKTCIKYNVGLYLSIRVDKMLLHLMSGLCKAFDRGASHCMTA